MFQNGLNKSHPIPLYYQMAEIIREQIRLGKLKPGDCLPSERELSDQAGISRMTVRQALGYLIREGLLVARPGLGTFVAEPKLVYDTLHLLAFTEEMMRQGEAPSSQVLEQAVVEPPLHVASALGLEPGETTVKIGRLRLSAGQPVLLETSHIPARLCPGLEAEELAERSLFALLEQTYHLRPQRSHQSLEATVANEYEAGLFGIELGAAMFLLEGANYLESGQPMEYFKAIYRGDRFKFELESYRNDSVELAPGARRLSVVME